jgi:hypothetical protein
MLLFSFIVSDILLSTFLSNASSHKECSQMQIYRFLVHLSLYLYRMCSVPCNGGTTAEDDFVKLKMKATASYLKVEAKHLSAGTK